MCITISLGDKEEKYRRCKVFHVSVADVVSAAVVVCAAAVVSAAEAGAEVSVFPPQAVRAVIVSASAMREMILLFFMLILREIFDMYYNTTFIHKRQYLSGKMFFL